MNYIIQTPSATRLKKEILDCVLAKVDANGNGIATWQCVEAEISEKVLVYTTDQWAEKGCIALKENHLRNEIQVRFIYWDSCEEKNNDDDKYQKRYVIECIYRMCSFKNDKSSGPRSYSEYLRSDNK